MTPFYTYPGGVEINPTYPASLKTRITESDGEGVWTEVTIDDVQTINVYTTYGDDEEDNGEYEIDYDFEIGDIIKENETVKQFFIDFYNNGEFSIGGSFYKKFIRDRFKEVLDEYI